MSPPEPDPAQEPDRGRDRPTADGADRSSSDDPARVDDEQPAAKPTTVPITVPILGADQPVAAWVQRSAASSNHTGAGCQFAVTLLVFSFGGWAADRWLGTTPWLLILGAAVGFSGALYSLVKGVPVSKRGAAGRTPKS